MKTTFTHWYRYGAAILVAILIAAPTMTHAYAIYPQYFPQYNPYYDPTPYPAAPTYIPQYNPYYDPNPYDNLGTSVPQYNPYYSPTSVYPYGAKTLRVDLDRVQTVGRYPNPNCPYYSAGNYQPPVVYPHRHHAYPTYPPGYPPGCPLW